MRSWYFWDIAPTEDNTFVLLSTAKNQTGFIHSSLTQWRNLFSLEVFGNDGYIQIEGLGGSYGTERLLLGKRALLEPFKEKIIEYRGGDPSLEEEWKEFVAATREGRQPLGDGYDGLEALKIVYAAYESSREKRIVSITSNSKY